MKLKYILPAGLMAILAVPLMFIVLVSAIIAPSQAAACNYFTADATLVASVPIKGGAAGLTGEQIGNARLIIQVASDRGLAYFDAKLALMVSMQESKLRNLAYGTSDSLGLFQQRPSQGWGTPQQIMNPIYATNTFFDREIKVADRYQMSLIQVAFKVQNPNRSDYWKTFYSYEPIADALLKGSDIKAASSPGPHKGNADAQLASFDTPCSYTDSGIKGKVVIAPGANLPGRPVTPETLAFLAKVAGIYGKPLICTTGTNHSKYTVDGNVSDHYDGHACDIGMSANGGSDGSPVGDRIATACLIAAGDAPPVAAQEASQGDLFTRPDASHPKPIALPPFGQMRIQCIWKTYNGGNHYTHVHIGARSMAPIAPQTS